MLDLSKPNQTLLFSIKESEHIHSLIFSSSTIKPLFLYHLKNFTEGKWILVIMRCCNLVFYLFSIHLGEPKIAQNTSELFAINIATVLGIVKFKSIFDFVILLLWDGVPYPKTTCCWWILMICLWLRFSSLCSLLINVRNITSCFKIYIKTK